VSDPLSAATEISADALPAREIHERQRAAIVAKIPEHYRPWLHLAIPSVLGLALMGIALARVHAPRPVDFLTIPLTLLGAFGFEWRVHKDVLHRRTRGVELLYERHELAHHVVYTYDDLTMRGAREWVLVLMPPFAVVLVALVNTPITLAVNALFGANAGGLYLATSMFFFLTYEWLHLAYHLPRESFIGRLSLVAALREHHRRHHDPRLMKRWNFNVTLPLFDWIHRSVWSPERERAADGARAGRHARRAAEASGEAR
jgi:hypothetical protein